MDDPGDAGKDAPPTREAAIGGGGSHPQGFSGAQQQEPDDASLAPDSRQTDQRKHDEPRPAPNGLHTGRAYFARLPGERFQPAERKRQMAVRRYRSRAWLFGRRSGA